MRHVAYTATEIEAYRKSFERRISQGETAARWEYALWADVVTQGHTCTGIL
jgi:hypothetical protein